MEPEPSIADITVTILKWVVTVASLAALILVPIYMAVW